MDLVVICSLVFTTIFTSVLGVDLLRNLKKNEMGLRINKIAGKEAKVKKDDKINKNWKRRIFCLAAVSLWLWWLL